jgi:deoxycytidylate deaminase
MIQAWEDNHNRQTLALNYLRFAYEIAAKESTDPSTQNGAVLIGVVKYEEENEVDEHGNVLYIQRNIPVIPCIAAANHFPRDVKESEDRWQRPLKYKFVEHAERNVIFKAAKEGFKTEGATLYCPWFACADCARAIIQAGIKEVWGHDYPPHKTQSSWKESIEVADQMLIEAGVKFQRIPGHFGVKIRFNGEIVEV